MNAYTWIETCLINEILCKYQPVFVWFERYVRFLTTRVVKHNYKSVSSPRTIAINREPFEEQDFVIRRAYLRKPETKGEEETKG